MNKKVLLLLSLCLTGLLTAHADSGLVLQMRDGQTHNYVLSQKPVMSFGDGTMTMKAADAEATFVLSDIENFHFADITDDGIRAVTGDEMRFGYVGGVISVVGQQGTVRLTDLSGRLLHATGNGQAFTYDLNTQPQGVYLLQIGKQTVRVYRK